MRLTKRTRSEQACTSNGAGFRTALSQVMLMILVRPATHAATKGIKKGVNQFMQRVASRHTGRPLGGTFCRIHKEDCECGGPGPATLGQRLCILHVCVCVYVPGQLPGLFFPHGAINGGYKGILSLVQNFKANRPFDLLKFSFSAYF